MTAREQTGDRQFYRVILAYDNFTNLLRESVNVIGHAGMICGNDGFRKHGAGGMGFYTVTFAYTLVQALNLASYVFLQVFAFALLRRGRSVRVDGQP